METLSDELLAAIVSFLPSTQDLQNLSLTNNHYYQWVMSSRTADEVFRELYKRHFPAAPHGLDTRVSGRELWQDVYHVYQSVLNEGRQERQSSRQIDNEDTDQGPTSTRRAARATVTTAGHPLSTVEVLPPEEEAEAIIYDNHDVEFNTDDRQPCVGYFGLHPLLPTSPTTTSSTTSTTTTTSTNAPIAIWGDFPGLKVAPCWDALLNPHSVHRDQLKSVHDERQSQVMDFRVHPQGQALVEQGYTSPFFIAFASGVVMAVAVSQQDKELVTVSTSNTHSSEVTALAILPANASSSGNQLGYLLSVCVNGQVYLYPDSLTKMNLDRKICLNPTDTIIPRGPVFSMSATRLNELTILCLGGQGLKVSLWQLTTANTTDSSLPQVLGMHEFEYEPHVSFDGQEEEEEEAVDHNITHISFVGPVVGGTATTKKDALAMGTSRGHIVTWDLTMSSQTNKPELILHTSHEGAHNGGSVESMERVGNVLLTTGGNDGIIKAMHIGSGLPLANLLIHPGRLVSPPRPPVRLKCAVVKAWVCHERQSIIGFCRDGHISEWSFQLHKLLSTSNSNVGQQQDQRRKLTASHAATRSAKRQCRPQL